VKENIRADINVLAQYSGLANDRAIGINHDSNNNMVLITKTSKNANKPASAMHTVKYGQSTPSRKAYSSIVSNTAKKGYRADLRAETVARASAIKKSQKPVSEKKRPAKVRGGKKKLASATAEQSS